MGPTDFSSVHQWWDKGPIPLLPPEQGSTLEEQIAAGMVIFKSCVDSGKPFCLIRLGDSDLALLSGGLMQVIHPRHDTDRLLTWGGTDRNALAIRPLLIDAVKRTDMLGLQQNWPIVARATLAALCMLHISFPVHYAVEVHLPYALLTSGALFEFIKERRVLLIGSLAGQLKELLQTEVVSKRYPFVSPLREVEALTVPGFGGRAYEVYDEIVAKTLKAEFDVALLAFGTYAKPLAVAIRDSGRIALDIGFCFDALLGNSERSVRPVLREVAWDENQAPPPEEGQT